MSIDRAAFSEHTASTRPAARWQSESANDPITRRRSATPRSDDALSAMYAVVVASKERISIGSFGGGPTSGACVQAGATASLGHPFLPGAEVVDEAEHDVAHRGPVGNGE